jgi:hypothetical protein
MDFTPFSGSSAYFVLTAELPLTIHENGGSYLRLNGLGT